MKHFFLPVVLDRADLELYYNKVCSWCIQPLSAIMKAMDLRWTLYSIGAAL